MHEELKAACMNSGRPHDFFFCVRIMKLRTERVQVSRARTPLRVACTADREVAAVAVAVRPRLNSKP